MNFWIRTSFSAIEMKYVSYLLGPFQKFSSLDEVLVDHYLRRKHRGDMGRRCHLRHSAALRLSRCSAIDITLLNSQESLSIHHSLDHLWPPRARVRACARELALHRAERNLISVRPSVCPSAPAERQSSTTEIDRPLRLHCPLQSGRGRGRDTDCMLFVYTLKSRSCPVAMEAEVAGADSSAVDLMKGYEQRRSRSRRRPHLCGGLRRNRESSSITPPLIFVVLFFFCESDEGFGFWLFRSHRFYHCPPVSFTCAHFGKSQSAEPRALPCATAAAAGDQDEERPRWELPESLTDPRGEVELAHSL